MTGTSTIKDGDGQDYALPYTLNIIPQFASHWVVCDDDKEINSGGTYVNWVPLTGVHGRSAGGRSDGTIGDTPIRNYLCFDRHAETGKKGWSGNP